jgi:hypothetical protein
MLFRDLRYNPFSDNRELQRGNKDHIRSRFVGQTRASVCSKILILKNENENVEGSRYINNIPIKLGGLRSWICWRYPKIKAG